MYGKQASPFPCCGSRGLFHPTAGFVLIAVDKKKGEKASVAVKISRMQLEGPRRISEKLHQPISFHEWLWSATWQLHNLTPRGNSDFSGPDPGSVKYKYTSSVSFSFSLLGPVSFPFGYEMQPFFQLPVCLYAFPFAVGLRRRRDALSASRFGPAMQCRFLLACSGLAGKSRGEEKQREAEEEAAKLFREGFRAKRKRST